MDFVVSPKSCSKEACLILFNPVALQHTVPLLFHPHPTAPNMHTVHLTSCGTVRANLSHSDRNNFMFPLILTLASLQSVILSFSFSLFFSLFLFYQQFYWNITSTAYILCIVIVQLLSCVQLFVTSWMAAGQVSLSLTITQSLLKLMSIELVMSSNHLILCLPLLLLPSIFPRIRVFSNESGDQGIGVSTSASALQMNILG